MKDWDTCSQDDKLLFQHYLLVFVDILGKRRSLREIKDLPTNDTEKEGFIKKLQETIGKVDALRDDLQRTPEEIPSPSWHADVLNARERRIREGKSQFRDWPDAKPHIRERVK